jgi:glycosyltransferase involved in cell wall biosynthesis
MRMKLLLCVPAYNEEEVIVPTLETLANTLSKIPGLSWHVLVADNASTDNTAQKVRELALDNVSVLVLTKKGKGLAVRAAVEFVQDADLFGFIDADLSAQPSSIPLLLEAIKEGADIAIGSRLLHPARVRRGFFRTVSSKLFNRIRFFMLGINVVDSQCGLKIMNKKGMQVLRECSEDTWFFDMELLARAQKKGLHISELPIVWEENYYPQRKSKLSVWRDGIGALGAMLRIRKKVRATAL